MSAPSIMFVLPVAGGGGGANSVMQEASGLSRLGAQCGIAVDRGNLPSFQANYPEVARNRVRLHMYDSAGALAAEMGTYDLVVATTNASVFPIAEALTVLKEAKARQPRIAYYVQDYEPLFYAPGSPAWHRARSSYEHIPGALLFAKTKWLQDIVYAHHGLRVAKVAPSIDHDIYYPDIGRPRLGLNIVAMLRPKTPRRAPLRTARIMEKLADMEHLAGATLTVFGTQARELQAMGFELSPKIANRGQLKRFEVPDVLRGADLFLDLSDYQAFGRTGLEAMTCGTIPVLPRIGGTSEYASHGHNAYVVDTRSDDEIVEAISSFVEMPAPARAAMRQNALETASGFTVQKAALSELRLFTEAVS